jgi:hypothetical protein
MTVLIEAFCGETLLFEGSRRCSSSSKTRVVSIDHFDPDEVQKYAAAQQMNRELVVRALERSLEER